jgi:hypothetical protein
MRRRPMMMPRAMVPMRGRCELLFHQQPTAGMPHDLPVIHAVARADRPVRKMRRASLVRRPVMRMRAPVLRPGGVMMPWPSVTACAARVMAADVDPAVAWTCAGHGRERRRWRQRRLGFGRRRLRRLGRRLLGLGYGLVGADLLRTERRSEDPERECCAGKDDTLHGCSPPPVCLRGSAGRTGPRIDSACLLSSLREREFNRGDARTAANAGAFQVRESTPRMKAPTSVLNASGRSKLERCPAPSTGS